MSAYPTQPVLEKKSYFYPGLLFQQFFGWLGIPLGLVFIGFGIHDFYKGGWIGIPLGTLVTWFSIYTAKYSFEKNRPLVIDETGISALANGKIWRSIAWSDVTSIERIRTTIYLQLGTRLGYEFLIVGPHNDIKLDDTISDFPVLLDTLNFYVQRYQIPLLARDKGSDTVGQIRATVKDKQERKKLLKEGVQSSIDVL